MTEIAIAHLPGSARDTVCGGERRFYTQERERDGVDRQQTMPKNRMRRVNEAVREVLSVAITNDLKDPRIGFVTVTAVDTSSDLRHAHVFVSVLGGDREREDSLAGLQSAHGYLQRRVASELRLKHTPTLEFVYDDTSDRAARIEEILEEREGDA